MAKTTDITAATAQLSDSRTQEALETVKKCITLFGAVGAIVLGTVAVMAFTGHQATSFMWIRGAILFLATFLLHRYHSRASQGSYKDFDRLRTLSAIVPIAIIGVDLIPGLCPMWYAVIQGLSALALIGVAVVTRGSALSAAFPSPGKK
ncbi:hypothetical protein LN042_33940 [Kitasatospora sp. RB6PN24]|uniref:hypothetical protein n=1 Tax=Kitasatospora humi TaxID=2893891 RepID=UPI001E55AC1B|nr:hypothetical protein [Kitasatospora humi]MCC9312006.1 hypothetical protein [Kitasatospora humi]